MGEQIWLCLMCNYSNIARIATPLQSSSSDDRDKAPSRRILISHNSLPNHRCASHSLSSRITGLLIERAIPKMVSCYLQLTRGLTRWGTSYDSGQTGWERHHSYCNDPMFVFPIRRFHTCSRHYFSRDEPKRISVRVSLQFLPCITHVNNTSDISSSYYIIRQTLKCHWRGM